MSTSERSIGEPLRPGRIALLVALFIAGALAGLAGALVQGGLFPGGLLLALLGAAGLFHGGSRLTGGKSGALAPGGGWLLTVLLLTSSRSEGDFVFAAGLGSYVYLLGGITLAVICATVGSVQQPDRSATRLGR
ncbi:hypothetical protein DSC45_16500 [Streptomyces sp. YIM 130001]|uniref:DUF6113 family protein n=1 Tax=Streptomyces sp. YIM 130001 TaxID=2259644 RepID=UPI000E64DDC1|nr:DUF6113 family protein [Streptomyces sp. YIM 130001]RII15842.1 hypothetical protein DSC45_16500 [Streptomyces sp. YIM 130001]